MGRSVMAVDTEQPMSPPTWSGLTWSVNGTVNPTTMSLPACTSGMILILEPSNMGLSRKRYTIERASCSILSVKILQSLQYFPLSSNIVVSSDYDRHLIIYKRGCLMKKKELVESCPTVIRPAPIPSSWCDMTLMHDL